MSATLATITPVNRRLYAYTTGAVTALGIANNGEYATRVNLGGALLDIIPPGTSRTYPLGNVSGFGGWVALCPVRSQAIISELARMGTQIVLTTYGGADTIPYGSATQPGEMAASADDLAGIDTVLSALYRRQFSARTFGAMLDGTTDDTAAVQACLDAAGIAGGGTVDTGAGTCLTSTPLAVTHANTRLVGAGRLATTIKASASFSGAAIVTITQADFCAVEHMRIRTSAASSATAPAGVDGISVTGSNMVTLNSLSFLELNGYCIEVLGSATGPSNTSKGVMISKIHCQSVAGGIHTQGVTAGSFRVQAWMSDLNLEGVDGPLDGIFLEDSLDVVIENVGGAIAQPNSGTVNNFLHIKGLTGPLFITNLDIGYFSNPGIVTTNPIVLIESSANGTPGSVYLTNGVIQQGYTGLTITGADDVHCTDILFGRNLTHGVSLEGSTAYYATFQSCNFKGNGVTNDVNLSFDLQDINGSARALISGNWFRSPVGATTANKVTAPINANQNQRVEVIGNVFDNSTPGSITTAFYQAVLPNTKLPYLLLNNRNVNPIGQVSVTVGASPYSVPVTGFPVTYYVTGGTVSSLAVGGVTLGITSGMVRVPPQTSFVITYTVAPTVVGFGD